MELMEKIVKSAQVTSVIVAFMAIAFIDIIESIRFIGYCLGIAYLIEIVL